MFLNCRVTRLPIISLENSFLYRRGDKCDKHTLPAEDLGFDLPEPVSSANYEGYLITMTSAFAIFSVLLMSIDKQAIVYGTGLV